MKKILVILSLIFIATSCSRNSENDTPIKSINVDGLLTVKVQDNSGKNVSEAFGNNLKIIYSEPATDLSATFPFSISGVFSVAMTFFSKPKSSL